MSWYDPADSAPPLSLSPTLSSSSSSAGLSSAHILAGAHTVRPQLSQQLGQTSPSLHRTQSRYFESFGIPALAAAQPTAQPSPTSLSSFANSLSALSLSANPPAQPVLHHHVSQPFDFYDSSGIDSRTDRFDYQVPPRALYHQASAEYVWKNGMQSSSGLRSRSQWLDHKSASQDYLPPRMPFLSSAPYSTSPTNRAYSPVKSDPAAASESSYSSSPQSSRMQSQISFSSMSSQSQGSALPPASAQPQPQQPQQQTAPPLPEDDLIPTAIVIKNIPFAVKKEQLMDTMMNLGLTLPYAFNYHFDQGVFRGLAFANFATPEDTANVIQTLNGHDIAGRKLRVEYKKMLPAADRERIEREKRGKRGQLEEQHRSSYSQLPKLTPMSLQSLAPSNNNVGASAAAAAPGTRASDLDLNNPETLTFYSEILLFKDDHSRDELVFSSDLTPMQRRSVHLLAQAMGLVHSSRGEGETREVVVTRRPAHGMAMPLYSSPSRQIFGDVTSAEFSGGEADSRQSIRGARSFADIRSSRLSFHPSMVLPPNGIQSNAASSSTLGGLYSQSLRAP
ncbi:uncharacterized protein V1518DRAFT_368944 [Limtongia smithiae]|uniref:uncharacterized protein n=1 Tax=Limtongia smithiae TaxID=1125753 RepID=UPI0034CE1070